MPIAFFLSLLPAIFGFAVAEQSDEVRTLVVEREVIMRIPVRPRPVQPNSGEEKKGPKCIEAGSIRGAALSGRESVDFLLYDHMRIRAQLSEDCPALDFYNGFVQQIERVTQADVQRVARKYLDPSKMAVVIVGDRKTVESGLRGIKVGDVMIRDITGGAVVP